ncbi:hypothetical protein FAZ69_28085 [Trinickia terrae]|uniref:Uncharacterized protein n=1 Tax=Trinickia terrae TaxID=2571161 RepID=A0A4U1HN58_9BURK|nr:hypothetical protein FAZ69_28085 [Trinickia terrae]
MPLTRVSESPSRPVLSEAIAMVNGTPVTQAELAAAVAKSGEPDTPGLRRTLKYRLIACELLWQAAQRRYGEAAAGEAQSSVQVDTAIKRYLRDEVRPAAVTDADVRTRYAQISEVLQTIEPGSYRVLGREMLEDSIRAELTDERLNQAIHVVVERLMEQADIRE